MSKIKNNIYSKIISPSGLTFFVWKSEEIGYKLVWPNLKLRFKCIYYNIVSLLIHILLFQMLEWSWQSYLPEVVILTLITSFQLLYSITCRTGAKGKSEMSGQVVVTVDGKNSSEDVRFTYKVQFWKTIPLLLCKHVHVYSREKKIKVTC